MDDHLLLSFASRVAEEAAVTILALRGHDLKITAKPDRSPVTEADLASQEVILAGLRAMTPDIPVVAEEPALSVGQTLERPFWLVDPLHGTREFATGLDEFVVNVGLVRDRRVVLGAVAVPALDGLFTGIVPETERMQDP
jgi:3'(2'), 5'-bisphosphate nucleotidase